MRRQILEDPFSRAAIWCRNLSVFAMLVALIGIVLARRGLDPSAALAVEGAALGLGGLAILCGGAAMVVIWRTGFRGVGIALGGLVLAGLLFAYPAYVAVESRSVPALTDVSTDLDDPPSFLSTESALAARSGTTPSRQMSKADRSAQMRLYPDLQSLSLDAEPIDVDRLVRKILKRRRFIIVDAVEPIRFAIGHIDVVAGSSLMGFPADLTIRIRDVGGKTKLDIRSVARGGWQEPGSNAARVLDLMADIETATDES